MFSGCTEQGLDQLQVDPAMHVFSLVVTMLLLCRELMIALHSSRHTTQHLQQLYKPTEHIHASGPVAIGSSGLAVPGHVRPAMPSQPLHPPPSFFIYHTLPCVILSAPSVMLLVSFLIHWPGSCLVLNHV